MDQAPEQVILTFGAGERAQVNAFLAQYALSGLPIVISPEPQTAFDVRAVPYGFAIDQAGTVRGKGIVNNADHLENLAKSQPED